MLAHFCIFIEKRPFLRVNFGHTSTRSEKLARLHPVRHASICFRWRSESSLLAVTDEQLQFHFSTLFRFSLGRAQFFFAEQMIIEPSFAAFRTFCFSRVTHVQSTRDCRADASGQKARS